MESVGAEAMRFVLELAPILKTQDVISEALCDSMLLHKFFVLLQTAYEEFRVPESSNEYEQVSARFSQTMPLAWIESITRIQNKHVYNGYKL